MKVRVTFYKFPSEITKEEKKNIFENFDIDKNFNNIDSEEISCSVRKAKILVKSYGGEAYTKFIDRYGKPYQILPLVVGKSKLREIREKVGISQKELAKKLCVTQSTVHNWETYKTLPLDRNRLYLAKILNCNVKDFMEDIFKHIHKYTSLGGTK